MAVWYSIAWGVKLKEGLSPEERGAFLLNLFFFISEEWNSRALKDVERKVGN